VSQFTFIDLFAGIGGTRHAFEQEGGECRFTCEIDDDAIEVYEQNWGDSVSEHDIRNVEPELIPDHDILLACWPCPSFSQMGLKKALDDERGNLFFEITDILNEKQPEAFLLENVKNLRRVNGGEPFEIVTDALKTCDYDIYYEVLNALDFGLPQHRERLIIVGFRADCAPDDFELPTKRPCEALDTGEKQHEALTDLLEDNPDPRFTATESARQKRRNVLDNPNDVPEPSVWHTDRGGHVKPRPYAGTLRAKPSWNYLLVDGERLPTNRELLRFQGFPEWFDLGKDSMQRAMRLTGNTVPIPMINECAKAILTELDFNADHGLQPADSGSADGFEGWDGMYQRI
jgi:DNA (cytosine-5)-methyltransferase 1